MSDTLVIRYEGIKQTGSGGSGYGLDSTTLDEITVDGTASFSHTTCTDKSTSNYDTIYIALKAGGNSCTVTLTGGGYFTDSSRSTNNGTSMTINGGGSVTLYFSDGDYTVSFSNVSSIVEFRAGPTNSVSYGSGATPAVYDSSPDDFTNWTGNIGYWAAAIDMACFCFANSNLYGNISPVLRAWGDRLYLIDISNSNVAGSINDIADCWNLTNFLAENCSSLYGSIDNLNLAELTQLDLDNCNSISGTFYSLENSKNSMKYLSLSGINLSGNSPYTCYNTLTHIGYMINLIYLDLSCLNLNHNGTNTLYALHNLIYLTHLDIHNTSLDNNSQYNTLYWLSTLTSLTYLNLANINVEPRAVYDFYSNLQYTSATGTSTSVTYATGGTSTTRTYATGGTSTSKAFPTGGINYKVCNLGSTIQNTNGTLTLYSYVDKHKVWEYPSESVYNYTGVPGYYYISGVSYLKSYDYSVNSSGYVSKYTNGYTSYLYPAISTYGLGCATSSANVITAVSTTSAGFITSVSTTSKNFITSIEAGSASLDARLMYRYSRLLELATLVNLTYLNLDGIIGLYCESTSDQNNSLYQLRTLTKLTYLNLANIKDFPEASVYQNILYLATLTNLTYLNLANSVVNNNSTLDGIKELINLTYLNLAYTSTLASTSANVLSALANMTSMTYLNLEGQTTLYSDSTTNNISYLTSLTNLEYLNLSHTSAYGGAATFNNFASLEIFKYNDSNITGSWVKAA